MTTKPAALIDLVESEINDFKQMYRDHSSLFPLNLNLYPIPFFGQIQTAEVLTLALNPAWTEFRLDRKWPRGLDPRRLTDRLLDYFDLSEAEPHRWFEKCHTALSLLGRSYQCSVAHIDLIPYPTKFLKAMGGSQREVFAKFADRSLEYLKKILCFCRGVKLVIVIDYQFPVPNGGATNTFEFLANHFPLFAQRTTGAGDMPPIFRGGGPDELAQRVRQHRRALRDCLQQGQFLAF